jgi:hypothetical protein
MLQKLEEVTLKEESLKGISLHVFQVSKFKMNFFFQSWSLLSYLNYGVITGFVKSCSTLFFTVGLLFQHIYPNIPIIQMIRNNAITVGFENT